MPESMHASERCRAPESGVPVVRLALTTQQAGQIAFLVLESRGRRENVTFFAVAIRFWSPEDESLDWELQATFAPARITHKFNKLILTGGKA
jgi:hypothetical protein